MPPVARYPTTSDGGGAILCPASEALVASLVEHSVVVLPLDVVAVGSLGTCLEGTATLAVGLGEVQEKGGTVGTDHLGAVDQDLSHPLGVAHEGGEAAGRDDLEHGSRFEVVGGSLSPRVLSIADRGWLSRVGSQFPKCPSGGRRCSSCPSHHAGVRAPAGGCRSLPGAAGRCTCSRG